MGIKIINTNEGTVPFFNPQKNRRMELRRGLNDVSEADFSLFERQLRSAAGVTILNEMNDAPVTAETPVVESPPVVPLVEMHDEPIEDDDKPQAARPRGRRKIESSD